jgi:heme/copper-type cytochrome/quinol oxidase subunit 1
MHFLGLAGMPRRIPDIQMFIELETLLVQWLTSFGFWCSTIFFYNYDLFSTNNLFFQFNNNVMLWHLIALGGSFYFFCF